MAAEPRGSRQVCMGRGRRSDPRLRLFEKWRDPALAEIDR